MINVKFGEEEYLEKIMKIFEEVKKFNFGKYKCFILFLKIVFLCNFLMFLMKKQNIYSILSGNIYARKNVRNIYLYLYELNSTHPVYSKKH